MKKEYLFDMPDSIPVYVSFVAQFFYGFSPAININVKKYSTKLPQLAFGQYHDTKGTFSGNFEIVVHMRAR